MLYRSPRSNLSRIYTTLHVYERTYIIFEHVTLSLFLTLATETQWKSPWTAMVKRSRYVCFFHLARHIDMHICYVYSTGRRVSQSFSRSWRLPLLGIGLYTWSWYAAWVVKQSVLFLRRYDGSCVILTFHFCGYGWRHTRCIRIFRIPPSCHLESFIIAALTCCSLLNILHSL